MKRGATCSLMKQGMNWMFSRSANAIVELYDVFSARMAENPDMSIDELRLMMDHWGDVTDEPRSVDYLETAIANIPSMFVIPNGCDDTKLVICVHGGGYCVGSMYSHRKLFGHVAKALNCMAAIVDYRRAPENLHPAQMEDTLAVYEHFLGDGYAPENIYLVGDSAGGNITVATLIAIRERGLALPGGAICMSPWFDPEVTGNSSEVNADADCFVKKELLQFMAVGAVGEDEGLQDPKFNVLHADLSGLPPIYIQVGGSEILLDDSIRFQSIALTAGTDVRVDIFPDMQHVFQLMAGRAPEADDAVARIATWVQNDIN